MRRIFMLIALLALVLNGPVPAGAASRTTAVAACGVQSCTGGTCVDGDEGPAEARSLDPLQAPQAGGTRRCHSGKPVTVPVAATPRLAALEPGGNDGTAAGPEPSPWPCALMQAPHRPILAATGGGSAGTFTTLPEGYPGVLARTCVLRI